MEHRSDTQRAGFGAAGGTGGGESDAARRAGQVGEQISQETADLGRQVADGARDLGHQVEEAAISRAEQSRHRVAEGFHAVSQALRAGASQLRQQDEQVGTDIVERLAEPVERISDYLERHETRELASDLEDFARRNEGLFLGGAFALGMLGARFLKSSARDAHADDIRAAARNRALPVPTTDGSYDDGRDRRLPSHQAPPTGDPRTDGLSGPGR
jgi:hypothetical protein